MQPEEHDLIYSRNSNTVTSSPSLDPFSFDSTSKCIISNTLFDGGIVTSPSSVISYYPGDTRNKELTTHADVSFSGHESSSYNIISNQSSGNHVLSKPTITPKKKRRRHKSDSSESVSSSMGSPDGSPRMLKKIGRVIQTTQSEKDLDTKVDYLVKNIMQKFITKEKETYELSSNVKQEYGVPNEGEHLSPRKIKSKKRPTVVQSVCAEHYLSKIKNLTTEKHGEITSKKIVPDNPSLIKFGSTGMNSSVDRLALPINSNLPSEIVPEHPTSPDMSSDNYISSGISPADRLQCYGNLTNFEDLSSANHSASESIQQQYEQYENSRTFSVPYPVICESNCDSPEQQSSVTFEGYKAAVKKYEDFMNEQQKLSEIKIDKTTEIKSEKKATEEVEVGQCVEMNAPFKVSSHHEIDIQSQRSSSAGCAAGMNTELTFDSEYQHRLSPAKTILPQENDCKRHMKQLGALSSTADKLSEHDLQKIAQLLMMTKQQYCTEFYKQLKEFSAGQNPEWLVNYPNIASLMGLKTSSYENKYDKAKQILQYMQAKTNNVLGKSSGGEGEGSVISCETVSSSDTAALHTHYNESCSMDQHNSSEDGNGKQLPDNSVHATNEVGCTVGDKLCSPSSYTVSLSGCSGSDKWKSPPQRNGAFSPGGRIGGFQNSFHKSVNESTQIKGLFAGNYISSTSSELTKSASDSTSGNFVHDAEKTNIWKNREPFPHVEPKISEVFNNKQPCLIKSPKIEKTSWINSEEALHGISGVNLQTSPLVDRLKNNIQEEIPECNCTRNSNYDDQRESPYYTHLGAGATVSAVRQIMEKRLNMSGNAIRIEKVLYTGKEGKNPQGCPIAKWVIRRSGAEEKVLVLVRPRRGHHCATSVTVIGICVWEGVIQSQADSLYDYLRNVLPKYGFETERRCGTNEKRTCACQGWDGDSAGASFTFGCSWSMYYNGCKFSKSTTPRKFRLKNQEEEKTLETTLQTLATQLGPLYKMAAPDSYKNMVEFENVAKDCRLGYEPGRPFSGVTAVVDFSAHSHKDQHNMNNGCTMVVTLTKHRGLSKPQSEQLHVLPLCVMDTTDETGNLDKQYEKIKNGSIEYLTKYPMKMRVRGFPLLSCKQRKKINKSGSGRGRGRGRKPVQNWINTSAKKVVWNSLYGCRGRGRGKASFTKKITVGNSSNLSKVTSNVHKVPASSKSPYGYSFNRTSRVLKSADGYKYRVLPDGRRMKLKPGRPLQAGTRHWQEIMSNRYHVPNPYDHTTFAHNSAYRLQRQGFYPNYAPTPRHNSQYGRYPSTRNPLSELSASQRGFYCNHIQWEQFYRRKECEDYFAQFGVPHPYLAQARNQVEKTHAPVPSQFCNTGFSGMSNRPSYPAPRVHEDITVPCQNRDRANVYQYSTSPYEHSLPQQNNFTSPVLPSRESVNMMKNLEPPKADSSKEITFLAENGIPPNKSVFDISSSLISSARAFPVEIPQNQPIKQEPSPFHETGSLHIDQHSGTTHLHTKAASSLIDLDSSLPSFGRTFMAAPSRNPYEEQDPVCESQPMRQQCNTSQFQVASEVNLAQDNVHKNYHESQFFSSTDSNVNVAMMQQTSQQPKVQEEAHSIQNSSTTSMNSCEKPEAHNMSSANCNRLSSNELKLQEKEPQQADSMAGAKEVYTECDENFMESDIGGVAIALTHGSVLFEVAKRELHATTAMKKPNRYEPTRISLVFYQHKNLNEEKHGYYEYLKKSEMWKQRRENKLAEQQKSIATVNPPAPTQLLSSHKIGGPNCKPLPFENPVEPKPVAELSPCFSSPSFCSQSRSSAAMKLESSPESKLVKTELSREEEWLNEVSIRSRTLTSTSVQYTWLKPQLAVTGPYQRWY